MCRGTRTVSIIASVFVAVLLLASHASAQGQAPERFTARLSPVPVDTLTVRTITGAGSIVAELVGSTLTLAGTFENMSSPATLARIHRAPKGLRGPAVLELVLTKATSGKIEGRLTLSAAQVDDLKRGRLFVQIATALNPDGQLRGWLLKEETIR